MASRSRGSRQSSVEIPLPVVPADAKYMENVLTAFVNGIPQTSYASCTLRDGAGLPSSDDRARKEHLAKFVGERLEDLARLEYVQWINGQLPFISPRELRLWRLQQFAHYVWAWQLPDDDDLAMIFNLTKRQASNLVADFAARFRKTALFPVAIRRVYEALRGTPVLTAIEIKGQSAVGSVFRIPSRRYVDDTNALINEFRLRNPRRVLREAARYQRDDQAMWVSDEVLQLVASDDLRDEIFALYPLPGLSG